MKYTCPNCGKKIEYSVEQLIESQYKVNCPQCNALLEIVGNYAYMPLEDGSLNLACDEPKVDPQPTQDPLYQQAVAFLAHCNAITPFMLMAQFGIDMERAQKLLQQLEDNGIVGPYNGGAPRTILIPHNTNLPYGLPFVPDTATQDVDGNNPENDPKIRTFSLNCSGPGCLIFILILTLIIALFVKGF